MQLKKITMFRKKKQQDPLPLCGRMSLICGRMSPLTTTPTCQLVMKAPRLMLPFGKSPECHPYITTSYASY